MDLGNGICNSSGFFFIFYWSYFFEHFDRFIEVKKFRYTELYRNSMFKSWLKSEILVEAVTKIILLNQDLDCSKWTRSFNIPFGAPMATQIFFYFLSPLPKAAVSQMGAEGASPLEGEGKPAEGGCFASIYIHTWYIYT